MANEQNAPAGALTNEQIDHALDAVLRASGSNLRNYTMPETLGKMRAAVRDIERAAIEAFRVKISQPSGFEGRCPRCWPAFCKCPAPDDAVESIKAERFLLDCELQRENRRAREFSESLRALADGVQSLYQRNLCEDEMWLELGELASRARQAIGLLDEPRNADRVSALYKDLENGK